MSAYVVDHDTINKILPYILDATYDVYAPDITALGYDTNKRDWLRQLGQEMLDLNRAAVAWRYEENPETGPFAFAPLRVSPVQAYSALRCWMYQCTEGNIPDDPLYRFFEKVQHTLAENIVTQLPEYAAAPWG